MKRPAAGDPLPFIKNDTVIGTIGNTQGVSSAAKPQRTASITQTPQGFGLSGSVAGNRLIRSIPGRNGCPGRLGIADRDLESPILGRIAIFLLAGTPVDIAFQYGALTRQGDFLTEDDFIEISTHFDLENIVVFAFGSVDLIRIAVERQARCRLELHQGRRNVRMQVVRMPSRQDLTRKYDFVIRIAEVLHSAVPGNGRGLRVSRQQTSSGKPPAARYGYKISYLYYFNKLIVFFACKDMKFYSKPRMGRIISRPRGKTTRKPSLRLRPCCVQKIARRGTPCRRNRAGSATRCGNSPSAPPLRRPDPGTSCALPNRRLRPQCERHRYSCRSYSVPAV